MIPRLGGVMLSALLHAGLILLLLAWSATDWTRPLFIDLVDRAESAGAPGDAVTPARSVAPPPAGRAPVPVPVARRVARRPEAAAPGAPIASPAAPAPPAMEPVVPSAPPMPNLPAEPVPPPLPPAGLAALPPEAPFASSAAGARGGSPEAGRGGSGARADGPVRGDAESGSGGASGASLALAIPGSGGPGSTPAEYGPYLQRFRQRVQESLIYPLAARRQGLAGTVELHVWLEPTGRVRDVQIARSSSHGVLDDAAVETIRRLGPVPFPESLPRRPLLIRIPLVYALR